MQPSWQNRIDALSASEIRSAVGRIISNFFVFHGAHFARFPQSA